MGTEIDRRWWRRYRHGFLMRGAGDWWIEEGCFHFHRWLTRKPLVIPLAAVKEVGLGNWHAGQWAMGERVIKLIWEHEGQDLSSGFILTRNARDARELREELSRLAGQVGPGTSPGRPTSPSAPPIHPS